MLGQDGTDVYLNIEGGGIAQPAGEEPSPGVLAEFWRLWQRFIDIWPQFLGLRSEIDEHRARWEALAQAAYAAGDIEGMRAYRANIARLEAMERERSEVEGTVARFKAVWDTIVSYIERARSWLGLSGLGLPPLLLPIGLAAAVAALAWVVNTYLKLRADLDFDREALAAAERGTITPQQAAEMIEARTGEGGLLSLGVPGLGRWNLTPLLLVGGIVMMAWWLGQARRR